MPTKEELEQQVKQLQDELKEAKEQDKAKKPMFVTKDKKLPRYNGTGDVEEWIEEIEVYCESRNLQDAQCVDVMMEHLTGIAKDEVRCREATQRETDEQIKGILRDAFGEKSTVGQLWTKFHSRRQAAKENVLEFSIALMKLLDRIAKLDQTLTDKGPLLKSRFTEGLKDEGLRRDAVRLDLDHPDWDFFTLRKRVLQIAGVDSGAGAQVSTVEVEQSAITSSKDEMVQLLKEYKDQLSDVASRLSRLESDGKTHGEGNRKSRSFKGSKKSRGSGRRTPRKHVNQNGERLCYRCNQPGHLIRNCPVEQRVESVNTTTGNNGDTQGNDNL